MKNSSESENTHPTATEKAKKLFESQIFESKEMVRFTPRDT